MACTCERAGTSGLVLVGGVARSMWLNGSVQWIEGQGTKKERP